MTEESDIVCGDMFWDEDATDRSYHSPDDILVENHGPACIVEFQQATRHQNFYGFYLGEGDEYGPDFHYFDTEKEAQGELEKLLTRGVEDIDVSTQGNP